MVLLREATPSESARRATHRPASAPRTTTAERLQPGDWIVCREVVESRVRSVERIVWAVRIVDGIVYYDVEGPVGKHARCVGVPVRLA